MIKKEFSHSSHPGSHNNRSLEILVSVCDIVGDGTRRAHAGRAHASSSEREGRKQPTSVAKWVVHPHETRRSGATCNALREDKLAGQFASRFARATHFSERAKTFLSKPKIIISCNLAAGKLCLYPTKCKQEIAQVNIQLQTRRRSKRGDQRSKIFVSLCCTRQCCGMRRTVQMYGMRSAEKCLCLSLLGFLVPQPHSSGQSNLVLRCTVKPMSSTARGSHTAAVTQQYCQVRGWLCKRGVKGPTGRRWRRRWFSTDSNGRLYYYKQTNNKMPRG